jgi:hypothetical protein
VTLPVLSLIESIELMLALSPWKNLYAMAPYLTKCALAVESSTSQRCLLVRSMNFFTSTEIDFAFQSVCAFSESSPGPGIFCKRAISGL